MKCSNCGEENTDGSKFCKSCGTSLNSEPENKEKITSIDENEKRKQRNIIIATIVIVCIILFSGLIIAMQNNEIPLETQDFDVLKMSVPAGSDFEVSTSVPSIGYVGAWEYLENEGEYSSEVSVLGISENSGYSIPSQVEYDKDIDGVAIFKGKNGEDIYVAAKEVDGYEISLMGRDANLMAKMINSVEITKSPSDNTQQETSPKTTQSSAPATTSMSILGGSFSTGGGLEDKTYASIYVGPEHAGEKVTIQIFYSRDGSTLNNGNMVPKTVTSSGYIEVRSADAYSKFPDFAEINLYDSSGSNLLDSRSVSLSPEKGTQSF